MLVVLGSVVGGTKQFLVRKRECFCRGKQRSGGIEQRKGSIEQCRGSDAQGEECEKRLRCGPRKEKN